MDNENSITTISKARSYQEMADFWETHSTADYEEQTYQADLTFAPTAFPNMVVIEAELMQELRTIAQERRVSPETLINVWLRRAVDQLQMRAIPVMQELPQ